MDFKIEEIVCEDCGVEYEVKHSSSEPIVYCAFCGADILSVEEHDADLTQWYNTDGVDDD